VSLSAIKGKIKHNDHHLSEALERYNTLLERTPKFDFRKRIAELRGESVQISADGQVATE
jgi:hypothetical protein